ncbi:MAG: peroxiredoxin [Nannocystaceae bacterium]
MVTIGPRPRALLLPIFMLSASPTIAASGCSGAVTRPDGGTGLLKQGDEPPALSSTAHDGAAIDLRALGGAPTVIYFYPKDNTPGCTKEACAFRDAWKKLEEAGIRVVGVSSDSLESHKAFAAEHELPFSLVADEQLTWAKGFGVDSTGGFVHRVTFLIGRDGKIAKVYPDVDPGVHAAEVIADVAALPG